MKRKGLFLLWLTLCMLLFAMETALAVDGNVISSQNYSATDITAACSHNWKLHSYRTQPTCTSTGTAYYQCTICNAGKTETVAALGHSYGSWTVITEATCQATGTERGTCTVCGAETTRTIAKSAHSYGAWKVTKEATCKETGKKVAACKVCGATKTLKIEKTDHTWGEWEIATEATDHTKGTRQHVCTVCGKLEKEEFYPDGTLYRKGDNPKSAVKEMQNELKELGFYSGKSDGTFGSDTEKAVKKFQKNTGLKSDGIAWPQTLDLLKKQTTPGVLVTDDVEKYTLQLEAEVASDAKETYQIGDVITFKWTVTNTSKKDAAKVVLSAEVAGTTKSKKSTTKVDTIETIPAGESVSGTWDYTVEKKDVLSGTIKMSLSGSGTVAKKKQNTNTVSVKFLTASGSGIGGTWAPPDTSVKLSLTKKVSNKPANKLYFVKGEKVTFTITVENTGKTSISDLVVTDPLAPKLKGNIGTLKSGKKKTLTVDYVVTDYDVGMGGVNNTVTASYTGSDGKLVTAKAYAYAPAGQPLNSLVITKQVINTPANGAFFVPGETVKFEITLINPTKKDFTNITVTDLLCKGKKHVLDTIPALNAGKTTVLTFQYVVTETQAQKGYFDNIVSATFTEKDKGIKRAVSNSCRVMAGLKGSDGIKVVKSVIDAPTNGKYYKKGEEIRYLIEITNNTVNDLTGIDVRDILAPLDKKGHRTIASDQIISSGETLSLHFSHVVTDADVKATYVTNQASAIWQTDKPFIHIAFSNKVTVYTAKVFKPRKPAKPKLEDDACESIMTGSGDGIAEYTLNECKHHTATAEAANALIDSGDYEAAGQLWQADIDELYTEWMDSEDTEGRQLVEDDQAAMKAQLDAWKQSMLQLTGDSEQVDALINDNLMNECVTMCYELHTAPEERTDTYSSSHAALSPAEASYLCETNTEYDESGAAHSVECQCETHVLVAEVTDTLLAEAENDEDRSNIWERVQALWLVELDSLYDDWYLAADEAGRTAIVEDRTAFGEALTARQQVLSELYPDHPAIANEVLARMIMKRTQYVCQLLHQEGILEDDE